MGLYRYQVDAVNYSPESLRESAPKRPDAAERMRRAHEAAAYEQWFRAEVKKELDDPSPELTDEAAHADMQAFFASHRKEGRA